MFKYILLLTAIAISNRSAAQTKMSIDEVNNHIGDSVTVCSKVYGIKALDKVTFINLGAAYPSSPLTVVIFAKDLVNFNELPSAMYSGKQICVTGILKDYKGKVEIIITNPSAISIQ